MRGKEILKVSMCECGLTWVKRRRGVCKHTERTTWRLGGVSIGQNVRGLG